MRTTPIGGGGRSSRELECGGSGRNENIDSALRRELNSYGLAFEDFVELVERDEFPNERLRTLSTFVGSDLRAA